MHGSILVAGTTSDAGKTTVTTGLCRALARRGMSVAPFKAQNMSNNSMVCLGPDGSGLEIGRAQWVQALAATAEPEAAMNPVLLKPGSDRRSHVVVNGRPAGTLDASSFLDGRSHLRDAAYAAFASLRDHFDVVVVEGAGSPAEINLRAGDFVNMGLARHANVPTVIVGDIDRGGVFAAFLGTVALLSPDDQALVAGFVVNKFRGDRGLLQPGIDQIEELTGRRVYGVLPWHPDLWLDSEDSLDLAGLPSPTGGDAAVKVVVVRLPRISNFTDADALAIEPGIEVVFASDARALRDADLVVLPGTRATLADLAWLRSRGLDEAVARHAAAGRAVLGICGGFQMLGRTISDPDGVEGTPGAEAEGLGLLDVTTTFGSEKVLRLPAGKAMGVSASGYEIHHGRVSAGADTEEFLGGARTGRVFGTMWHGSLEGDAFRNAFLREVVGPTWSPSGVSFSERREGRFELLADLVEEHLDVDALVSLARTGTPSGVPFLPPGAPT